MLTATIAASSSGDNVIVTGVAGYAIRVIGYHLTFAGTVNAQWMSDTGGSSVALSGLLYGAENSRDAPGSCGPNQRGWFQTASGKSLNLNLSAAVAVGGHLVYELVSQ